MKRRSAHLRRRDGAWKVVGHDYFPGQVTSHLVEQPLDAVDVVGYAHVGRRHGSRLCGRPRSRAGRSGRWRGHRQAMVTLPVGAILSFIPRRQCRGLLFPESSPDVRRRGLGDVDGTLGPAAV